MMLSNVFFCWSSLPGVLTPPCVPPPFPSTPAAPFLTLCHKRSNALLSQYVFSPFFGPLYSFMTYHAFTHMYTYRQIVKAKICLRENMCLSVSESPPLI